jgi:hypothetical protein
LEQGTAGAPAHPLALIRRSRGWSYQELARVVAENARQLGVPMAARREKVWRWEHWGVVPEPDSQRALARALGVPLRELDARPWPGWLPAGPALPTGLPWTAEGALTALRALLDDDVTRDHPAADGAALREAVAEAREALTSVPPGPPEDTRREEPGTVAWLRAGMAGLRRLDDHLGGAAVRHRVGADLRIVADLLGRATRPPVELHRTAAELAELGGWAADDTGAPGSAQRHFLTGLRAAHAAGDLPLAAAILSGLGVQSLPPGHAVDGDTAGRARDALVAADAADAVAAGATAAGAAGPRTLAMLAARRARVLGVLGEEDACRAALAEAGRLLAAADAPEPSWVGWFDDAQLDAHAGLALLALGRPREALPRFERALAGLDPAFPRDRCACTVAAATACARDGDQEGGWALAGAASRMAETLASPRLSAALDALRQELTDASPTAAAPAAGSAPHSA